jgi:hypothetical protein
MSIFLVNICLGGECPGDEMKLYIRTVLGHDRRQSKKDAFDKVIQVGARFGETLGYQVGETSPSTSLHLSRGGKYGEDGRRMSTPTTLNPIPLFGYFEMMNKSTEMCCIKVLLPGGHEIFEIPRPSYLAVPPGEALFTDFNPNIECIYVLVLYGNPNPIPPRGPLVYDTTAFGVNSKRITPCAQVAKFNSVVIYKISCRGHNVLLKYQNGGVLASRLGNSIARVGLFGALQGHRYVKNRIDFSTNVSPSEIEVDFRGTVPVSDKSTDANII